MQGGEDVDMLFEYIANIGMDAIRDEIKDFSMEVAAKNRLNKFLKKQEKLNFNCTLEKEVDFEGLTNYIRSELLEDVKLGFFGISKHAESHMKAFLGSRFSMQNPKQEYQKKKPK